MIPERVRKTLEESQAIADATKLIVAVSGGCDSIALLHILNSLRDALGVELHVASLNHGIRGAAGQGDLEFVAGVAANWDLPHSLERVDVPLLARNWDMGVEAAARRARYEFLARVAQQQSCRCVVTGHHALDQAETILMNIVRGSGMRGLGGMRLVSPLPAQPQFRLIRPLLSTTRTELEQYCSEHNLPYRQDETNWDTSYGRNFMRRRVVPKLERLNPDVTGALNRLAEAATTDEEYITLQLDALAKSAMRSWDDGCRISKSQFFDSHAALQRRLLRRAFEQLAKDGQALTHELTLDLVAFCQTAQTGASRDIGAALELVVDYTEIRLQRKGCGEPRLDYRLVPIDTDRLLRASGRLDLAGLYIIVGANAGGCDQDSLLLLPADCVLRLRTRRPGDRFKPKGMGGRSRKLKDWMIDRKIPRRLRDRIPLLCANDSIVAICLGADWRLAELGAMQGRAGSAKAVCLG